MYNRNDIIYPENYETENENQNTKEVIPSLKNCSELNNLDSSKLPDPPAGPPPDENDKLIRRNKDCFWATF